MKAQSDELKRLGQALRKIRRTPRPLAAKEQLQAIKTGLIGLQLLDQDFADRLTRRQWDTLLCHLTIENRDIAYTENWFGPYAYTTWFTMRFRPDNKQCVGKLILLSRVKPGGRFVETYKFLGGARAFRSILQARFRNSAASSGNPNHTAMLLEAQLRHAI